MTISAEEQFLIELINADRLDPEAAAAAYGTPLNEGVTAAMGGPLQTTPMQVLAPNAQLEQAANNQSAFLLEDGQYFGHTGEGGSTLHDRVIEVGYANPRSFRENLSVVFNPGSNLEALIRDHHENLYDSPSHRAAIFDENQADIGIGLQTGEFRGSNASMLTEVFGLQTGGRYVTGVAYSDSNNNDFYNIGEAISGVTFTTVGASANSADAGGYALDADTDSTDVTISIGGTELAQVTVDTSEGNAKLDLIEGSNGSFSLAVSTDTTLTSGIGEATLLGAGDLSLTGHDGDNRLLGNSGHNVIRGGDGDDIVKGYSGWDNLHGGAGNDLMNGGLGRDRLYGNDGDDVIKGGSGLDKLFGNAGDDKLVGGSSRDKLFGGSGNDILKGGSKNDLLDGGKGNDLLKGGTGNDTLKGGAGDDILRGGSGADKFVFNAGADIIRDFKDDVDTIAIDDALVGGPGSSIDDVLAKGEIINGDAVFTFDNGSNLTVEGVDDLDILANDLILV